MLLEDIFDTDSSNYQVALLSSNLPTPFWYLSHPWFATYHNRESSRVEVLGYLGGLDRQFASGLIKTHNNIVEGFQKAEGIPFLGRHTPSVNGMIQGGKNSLAHTIYKVVNNIDYLHERYPHINEYIPFPGPNSNTFAQWIINQFPKAKHKFQLPSTALGKDF
ncbi:MAG: DUF3750 domain-containing protein [Candidatus Nanoarchaeia archaeon]